MAKEKARTVRRYFDTIARKYDLMNTLLSFGLHHGWKQKAVRMAELATGSIILDVCGGTADLAIRAAGAAGGSGTIVVYDFSLEMLRAGRKKIKKHGYLPVIVPVCGDAERIAARDNTCDVALVGFGLRNLTDMQAGLRELRRVLKPGGRLVCLEFSRPTSLVFRLLYDLYSFYGIPLVGRLVAGSREAYAYLPDSIRKFPLPDELSAMMQAAGFSHVRFERLVNGIAVLHVGSK